MDQATDSPQTAGATKPNQINLGEVVNNYLDALQRVFDVINYTLAAERLLSEQEYENFSRANRVMPSQRARLDYERAKDEMNTWLLKQTLNETLGVLVLFLDDCRTLATLSSFKSKQSAGEQNPDLQKTLQEERNSFAKLALPAKIDYLKEHHNITSPSNEHIVSLYHARRSLANRNGTISEDNATDGKNLVVKLRSVQLKAAPSGKDQPGVFVTSEVGDITREFPVGDKVHLNKQDHLNAILTAAFFITTTAQSLKEYAQKLGVSK